MGFSFVQIKEYAPGAVFTATAAANHVGGNTTYTGTFSNDNTGHPVTITGFTNGNNNGSFTVVSNTSTTMTVNNPNGVAETHAGSLNFGSASLNSIFVQITPTVGNFLIVVVWVGNSSAQTVSSVADTVNTYSNTNLHINNGSVNSGTSTDMWYAPVTTGGTLNVTATWPSGGGYSHMVVVEYSGVTSFDFGSVLGGSQTTPTITNGSSTSNELEIWTLLDGGFTTIVWNQSAITSRTSANNGGPVGNSAFSFAEQPNPQYYTTGSTTFGGGTNIIMQSAVFKTNTSASNALSPYMGYGVFDCGGVALPAMEPSSTIFANQFNFLPAPVTGGSRGPTNSGVAYQGAGGGTTSGFGQIFPTGRKPIG
jgi:hypothetical protein